MIYLLLKRVVKWSFLIFFRRKVISGINNIPMSGPLIIAVNHPNTLIDPLLVASQIKRKVGFLANASIFINAFVKAIFNYFWVIPVYRKKDLKPGEIQDNSESFRKCYEFFDRDGALLIFPEGTSVNELKLRDIKKGSAWIALGYESERNFEGGLHINTVTISYSNPGQFRSMVAVNINPAFKVSEYKDLWMENREEAVLKLTDRIRREMEEQITLTENKEQERTVLLSQKFYTEYIDTSLSRYSNPLASFDLRRKLAEKFIELEKNDSQKYNELSSSLNQYFEHLNRLKLSPGLLRNGFLNRNKWGLIFSYLLQVIFLFPFYIAGLLTNYIPYRIPDWIFKILKPDEEYRSSISVVFGMIVFPLYYVLNVYLFHHFISDTFIWNFIFLISLPIMGFLCLYYWKIFQRFLRILHFYFSVGEGEKALLIKGRNDLSTELSSF